MLIYYTIVINSNTTGLPLASQSVTIKNKGAGSTATIYSDATGAASSNPLTTDSNGYIEFWAPAGAYKATCNSGEIDFTLAEPYGQTELVTVAISSSTVTLNGYLGNTFYTELTEDVTLAFSNIISSNNSVTELTRMLLVVDQDVTGSWEITYPESVNWLSGTEEQPAISGRTILEFISSDDGTTWYAQKLASASSLSGDVIGPSSSTDNAIPRFDGTGGKTLQGSSWSINDSQQMTAAGTLNMAGNHIAMGAGKFRDDYVTLGVALGESGGTALSGFTAASIIGALNEAKAGIKALDGTLLVTVDETNGDYQSIQDAIDSITDAASDKRYCVLVYPGDYAENIILDDYICLFGIGSRGAVKITASSGVVLTTNAGSNSFVANIHLSATGTAKIIDVPAGSTYQHNFFDCKLTYSSSTDYVDAITHASGELRIINTEGFYTNSGTTTGDNEPVFYSMTGSTATYYFDRFDIEMTIADASDTAIGIEEFNTALDNEATRSSLVINCTGGADAIGTRFKGSGQNKRVNRTNLFLYGNGGTGKTITTNGDGCNLLLEFNNSSVTGFDLNYQAEVASGDTATATFGLGRGEQGTLGSGIINIVTSNAPGSLLCNSLIALDSITSLIDATGLVAGVIESYFSNTINRVGSTGGEIDAISVNATNSGSAEAIALSTGSNVSPIKQRIGGDAALGKAWSVDSTVWTDRTTAFNTAGTDVQLFNADNDVIYIGSTTTFSDIPFIFATPSNITIDPTFEYWNGAWTAFTPNDGTIGMTQNGTVNLPDLSGDWATTTVNSEADGPWYYIRITRTRNLVGTPPTESKIQVQDSSSGTYGWDKTGLISCSATKADIDITNISNPPTDAELDAAFGAPATVGAGWRKSINDNNTGSNFYEVQSDGTNWWVTTWTKAT